MAAINVDEMRQLVSDAQDDYIKAQIVGLVTVMIVREWERRFREIVVGFARRCHEQFGIYTESHMKNINGKISIADINNCLGRFGIEVRERFVECHRELTTRVIENNGFDPVAAYNSIVTNRHEFVHKGNAILTFEELEKYYPVCSRIFDSIEAMLAERFQQK